MRALVASALAARTVITYRRLPFFILVALTRNNIGVNSTNMNLRTDRRRDARHLRHWGLASAPSVLVRFEPYFAPTDRGESGVAVWTRRESGHTSVAWH